MGTCTCCGLVDGFGRCVVDACGRVVDACGCVVDVLIKSIGRLFNGLVDGFSRLVAGLDLMSCRMG